MNHKLEADSIQLQFGGRRILSSVYLRCETGKIIGLLGRNGQGKSCLLQIIYGSLTGEKSIRFDNIVEHQAFKRPDLLRYLPQFNFIPGRLSLRKIFADFELDYSPFERMFSDFTRRYKSPVASLSGGQRRLVELYIIIKSSSHFAMLDEPFTHLSPLQINNVKELLIEAKQRKGLLITDHMYRHVMDICDDLYVLLNGTTHLTKSSDDIEMLGYARL